MAAGGPVEIDPLSITSLYLKINANGQRISTATGFVVQYEGRSFLVSNWHVFSGRHPDTGHPLSRETAAIPDRISVAHQLKHDLGSWQFVAETLINEDGSPRWVEHPAGGAVDVACLEIGNLPDDVRIYPLDLALADVDLQLFPGMQISVTGFPLGLRPNACFGIWKTGHIASDPDYPHRGYAAFLIDATTRGGMSGSPVVARAVGARMTAMGYQAGISVTTKFLGIYSSRIHEESEIGCVWRPSLILEVLRQAASPSR
jgi:hypothetical protein